MPMIRLRRCTRIVQFWSQRRNQTSFVNLRIFVISVLPKLFVINRILAATGLPAHIGEATCFMLRIQKSEEGALVVLRLIGRIEAEGLAELQTIVRVESRNHDLVLNLKDVMLVDRDGVKFLGRCEAGSIKLWNCPAYVRRWITRQTECGELGE
jgi:hypothetical protein